MKSINENVLQNLKYVKVPNPQIDLGHFPDFLIVGLQRTGTTWLYYNMRQHPQVLFSKPKEIFFNWTSCVKEENFWLGYYDDIQQRPEELLTKIWTFLGVRSEIKYNKFARNVINATESVKIPEQYRKILENIYQDEMQKLNQQFGLSW